MQPQKSSFNKLQAVIFDWSGTLVDFGSLAPTQIFVDAFASFDISLSLEQARGPMGLSKKEHIRQLLAQPQISAQWQSRFGRAWEEEDVTALYERFLPKQIEKVGDYSAPIEGAADVLALLHRAGVKVGGCTGYPREVLDVLLPLAAAQGLKADHVVAGDELAAGGRPGPWMALANVLALRINCVSGCVKVDDTVPGIEEGRNAGMWSVGLSVSGNEVGLSASAWQALDATRQTELRATAEKRLYDAGAHFVIDTVADLPGVLAEIDRRLAIGERP